MTTTLSLHRDGFAGKALGAFDGFEYAQHFDDIYRRPATHAGTYGGWRWECTVEHAQRYAKEIPLWREVIAQIDS